MQLIHVCELDNFKYLPRQQDLKNVNCIPYRRLKNPLLKKGVS